MKIRTLPIKRKVHCFRLRVGQASRTPKPKVSEPVQVQHGIRGARAEHAGKAGTSPA